MKPQRTQRKTLCAQNEFPRLDFLIEDEVILELKAVESIHGIYAAR